jgi:hypothetical protein
MSRPPHRDRPPPKGVLSGEREPIFSLLSEEVRRNMQRRGSESALLWDCFYPFARRGLSLSLWSAIRPLWGSPIPAIADERLEPYFWGMSVDGAPLSGLSQAAEAISGREDRLEVDLFLKGDRSLIAVEAKIESEPGRCIRFEAGRCPEVHGGEAACRYWEGGVRFADSLDFGERPNSQMLDRPPCAGHYQLARTLLMAEHLSRALDVQPSLCLLVPRRRWPALRAHWLDFAERVRDEGQWRRLRVVAWEDLGALGAGQSRPGSPAR